MTYRTFLPFKYGFLRIEADDEAIMRISFEETAGNDEPNKLTQQAARQISEYLMGIRENFDLPLKYEGTLFQKRVWQELTEIPYGTTVSYKELGRRCGISKGYQAIGQAVGRNPLVIVIPCHRVINSDGSIGGFTGGEVIKRYLLEEVEHIKRLP